MKVRGYRIELGEIEAALREQEWGERAVVVARERRRKRARSSWWRMWCRRRGAK